jgi:hypothetical protein
MKILSNYVHGIIDYTTVVIFLLGPQVMGFGGTAAQISYALAAIHFVMSFLTNMPLGAVKLIPMKLHSYVEFCVAPVLIGGSLLLPALASSAREFFAIMGALIFVVWLISHYRPETTAP